VRLLLRILRDQALQNVIGLFAATVSLIALGAVLIDHKQALWAYVCFGLAVAFGVLALAAVAAVTRDHAFSSGAERERKRRLIQFTANWSAAYSEANHDLIVIAPVSVFHRDSIEHEVEVTIDGTAFAMTEYESAWHMVRSSTFVARYRATDVTLSPDADSARVRVIVSSMIDPEVRNEDTRDVSISREPIPFQIL